MSEKRRDNRNRILHEGEYQRADGRYRFRYIDEDGKEKNVYSWRLDKNDPMPKGKKRELSLREKEKQIEADLFDHIVTNGGNYTVLELVEKYVSLGDSITRVGDLVEMGDCLNVKSIDNRGGCFLLIEAIRAIAEAGQKPDYDLYAVFSVQEEVGLPVNPDVPLMVMVSYARPTTTTFHRPTIFTCRNRKSSCLV